MPLAFSNCSARWWAASAACARSAAEGRAFFSSMSWYMWTMASLLAVALPLFAVSLPLPALALLALLALLSLLLLLSLDCEKLTERGHRLVCGLRCHSRRGRIQCSSAWLGRCGEIHSFVGVVVL
jgi:hypothetical protein